jgi:hypothetical protein
MPRLSELAGTARQWLRHAFAVDSADPDGPTPAQRAAAEHLCREVVRRRLTTPALMFLEASRGLNYVGAQVLHFFKPLIASLADGKAADHFAEFLERRDSIDFLCRRIEELEAEADRSERQPPPASD